MWWENEFLRLKDKKLYLGRSQATTLARRYGTPVFVYSRARILANYERLRAAFSSRTRLEIRICYAMKANSHPGILQLLRRRGAWLDAVSPEEVEAALRLGFPGRRILFTGTSVSGEDLRRVFNCEGVIVNIDALEQLEVMREAGGKGIRAKKTRVSVRWNPGGGRGFNPAVVTAGKKSRDGTPVKFGIEEKKVFEAFEKASSYGFVPVALHQHLGSGWVRNDYAGAEAAARRMIHLAAGLERQGVHLEFLDFGGGFGPKYTGNQGLFPLKKYAARLCSEITTAGLKIKAIAVEPGKYLAADAGVLLTRVEYLKESHGQLFACVNAGTYTSLPRVSIYPRAHHEIVNCSRVRGGETRPVTVAGNLCETADVFGRDIPLPLPRRGDILAVLNAGAYGRSMASNFNLRKIPGEVII